ncbi:MAG: SRPBCC family protein [Gammaproteobacteria bacterium]|nr:SRPBCC family protein [Gammaproteobacteria bacterium]MBU1444330.1 SRPBCC family protein [Gammaproteobacteria bacterium]MBU2285279.1 SRPBCC family protein [Gammaproteobacteria bacterium]
MNLSDTSLERLARGVRAGCFGVVIARASPLVLGVTGALCLFGAASAQQLEVESSPQDDAITVRASADLKVEPAAVWAVITDYDHLADFIPDMVRSHVIGRVGDRIVVRQQGEFRFLLFRQSIDVKLMVVESPQREVVARAVDGNLKVMEGRYTLSTLAGGGVRLSYAGRLVPDFSVPPIIGRLVLRNELEKQFAAVVKEIRRRDALAGPAQSSMPPSAPPVK